MKNEFEKYYIFEYRHGEGTDYTYIAESVTEEGDLCNTRNTHGLITGCFDVACYSIDNSGCSFIKDMLCDLDINILEVIASTEQKLREEDIGAAAGDINYYQYFCDFDYFYDSLGEEDRQRVDTYIEEHTMHTQGTYYNAGGEDIIVETDDWETGIDNIQLTIMEEEGYKVLFKNEEGEEFWAEREEEGVFTRFVKH